MNMDTLHPFISPEVDRCSYSMINQAIALAAAEFCRATLSWTEITDPFVILDGVRDYDIDAPSGALPVTILEAWIGSRLLVPGLLKDVMGAGDSSEPIFYTMEINPATVSLFPIPANPTGASVVMRVAYAPKINATTLPDFFEQDKLDALLSGTKARLMAMPGQPWTNPAMSAYYKSMFDAEVMSSRIEEAHGRVRGSPRVQSRRFGL
jgi:hypothetical protein